MAKHNLQWDENKLKRFLREGRGQGEGQDYKPWVTVQDFPSKGRCSRVLGWKTNRIHHLFTDSETRYFYLLEWEDAVVDIREHYPLLDLEEVIKEKESYKQTTITKTVTVKEPKPYIPKWVWWSLVINIVLLYLKFKNPIFKLIEYYKK